MTQNAQTLPRRLPRALLAALVALALCVPPAFVDVPTASAAGTTYTWWVESAQTKVYPTSRPPAHARTAGSRTTPPIAIGAAKSEYEGVQVTLRPSGDGIKDIWIEASDLVHASTGTTSTIASDTVEVFKVHYVNVAYPSYGYTRKGLEPDALIPMTLANGERLGWQPHGNPENLGYRAVGKGKAQPFYVLFHVPAGTDPGTYWGTLTVTCIDRTGSPVPTQEIPVMLEVFPFNVTNRTLATSFGLHMGWAAYANSDSHKWLRSDANPGPDADRVPERTGFKADQMGGWLEYFAEHRISPQMMLPAWENGSNWAPPDDAGDMVARDAYLTDYLGTGPATTRDGDRFAFTDVKMPEYGAPSYVKDPFASSSNTRLARQYWQTMRSELDPWLDKAYAYPIDEPSASQRAFVERYAGFVHDNAPGVPFMVTTDPVTMGYRLLSGVDIYGHKLHFFYRNGDQDRWIEPIRRANKDVWIYSHATTHQKDVPMFLVDKPLAESRVQGWFVYHSRAEGLLHFSVNAWRPSPGQSTWRDPYVDPLSYRKTTNGVPIYANGDGSLVYPGYYPAQGLVLQGAPPVGSLRMEALRDGLEDYEYLKKLQTRAGRSAADAMVAQIIGAPEGVYEAGRPTFPGYSKSSADYQRVRNAIAARLGAPTGWDARPPRAASGGSRTADAYEGGAGDDTPGTALDITDDIPGLPFHDHTLDPLAQTRTIDTANDAQGADEDWLTFELSPEQVAWGVNIGFEALSGNGRVDPVIEIYGPGAAIPTTPSGIPELLVGGVPSGRTGTDPAATAANDEGAWYARRQASASLSIEPGAPGAAGRYWVRIRPYYQGSFGQAAPPTGYGDGAGPYTLRVRNGQVQRLSSSDRYRTAVEISRERYSPGDLAGGALVVATGMAFPDALAGSTLAGAVGGPILLTAPGSLPSAVRSEIDRLDVSTVYVLGGRSAVSDSVLSAIDRISGVSRVERIQGSDRFTTAIAAARKANSILRGSGGVASTAFVVNGLNFPDALAASPVAAQNGAPILLTSPSSLPRSVRSAIRDLGVTDVVLVGGTAVVSPAVEDSLEAALGGSGHVRRLSGPNRYETGRAVAAWATELNVGSPDGFIGTSSNPTGLEALANKTSAGFAAGGNYPDALAGGVICGYASSPVILVEPDAVPEAVWKRYFGGLDRDEVFGKSYLYGGSSAVGDPVYFQLDALSSWVGVR